VSTKERPANGVCVLLPVGNETSIVTTANGEPYLVEIENGRRVIYLPRDDARMLLNSGLPESLAWREANMQLADWLGRPPQESPGINVGRLQHATWEATRPRTIMEDVAALRSAVLGGWRTW
jgi:hypothetical protein